MTGLPMALASPFRHSLVALVAAAVLGIAQPAKAQEPLTVVTSFSILADLVRAIGGDRVEVIALIGPGADAHAFEPRPGQIRLIAESNLVVVNGLGFDSWVQRLADANGYAGPVVIASEGVPAIVAEHDEDHDHGHGAIDPHAWQNVANAVTYVRNIAAGLTELDPGGAAYYRANLATYETALDELDAEIRAIIGALPPDYRLVVTSHDAFGHFGAAYGLEFVGLQGVNPEAAPGAGDMAAVIEQIRAVGATAIFVEAWANPALIEQIARETGAAIGGTLYADTLSEPAGPAATYLDMMRHNARTLAAALGG